MAENVKIELFPEAIIEELKKYSHEVDQDMQEAIDETTKTVLSELKKDPEIPKRTGGYRKGFYKKTVAKGIGFKRNVIANKEYRLTHLLERGHIIKSTGGRTKAFPHWEKAEKRAQELAELNFKKRVGE